MKSRPDLLDVIARLQARITALETGAHPLPTVLTVNPNFPKTVFPDESTVFNHASSGSFIWWPFIRKSSGVVSLSGSWSGDMSLVDQTGVTPERLSTLPQACWPDATLSPSCTIIKPDNSATRCQLQIDGEEGDDPGALVIFNSPGLDVSGYHRIILDGITWAMDSDA